ncbi:MAG: hypothetical protein OEY34_00405 [Cyclobacteriaceae bacterium]|nr:hypothetical protein [Cyclobacteriaceae bacterium]
MKKLIFGLIISLSSLSGFAQFVAKMEIEEPIEGLCNEEEVYSLFPMFGGQDEAVCPLSDKQLLERLNAEVQFLKDHPKYSDKGMIGIIINCKGEIVQCKMDNKTKDPELDKQIEEVFRSLGDWKAGKLNGKEVDSSKLYSFKIKKGIITFD